MQSLPAFPEGVDPAVNQRNRPMTICMPPKWHSVELVIISVHLSGLVSDDSAVRNLRATINLKVVLLLAYAWQGFGSARIEGEYSFLSHKIHSESQGSGSTNFHNLNSRLILEKNLQNVLTFVQELDLELVLYPKIWEVMNMMGLGLLTTFYWDGLFV